MLFLNISYEGQLATSKKAVSPSLNSLKSPQVNSEKKLRLLPEYFCLKSPYIPTQKYLRDSSISRYSLSDILEANVKLNGEKIVILSGNKENLYKDTDSKLIDSNRSAFPHELTARFINEIFNERNIEISQTNLNTQIVIYAILLLSTCVLLFIEKQGLCIA